MLRDGEIMLHVVGNSDHKLASRAGESLVSGSCVDAGRRAKNKRQAIEMEVFQLSAGMDVE